MTEQKQALKVLMAMAAYNAKFDAMLAIKLPDGSVYVLEPNQELVRGAITNAYNKMRESEAKYPSMYDLIGKRVELTLNKQPQPQSVCKTCGQTVEVKTKIVLGEAQMLCSNCGCNLKDMVH